jgi:hypothetical protein
MLVDDRIEYIGTSECLLSSEHYEHSLKATRGVAVIMFYKPTHIRSRVSRVKITSSVIKDAHNLNSARRTLC